MHSYPIQIINTKNKMKEMYELIDEVNPWIDEVQGLLDEYREDMTPEEHENLKKRAEVSLLTSFLYFTNSRIYKRNQLAIICNGVHCRLNEHACGFHATFVCFNDVLSCHIPQLYHFPSLFLDINNRGNELQKVYLFKSHVLHNRDTCKEKKTESTAFEQL